MCEDCCGLTLPQPLHFFLLKLNPFSYLSATAEQNMTMGTVTFPTSIPSPEEDAEKLKKAFQGWGTDEKAIIDILAHRTAAQKAAIAEAYSRLYNVSLLDSLHSELSGDFGKAVIWWTTDPAERDAKFVNEALKKKHDRELWVIIEVACASSPDHLIAVRQAYCSLFSSSLEEDIGTHFSQQEPLGQLFVRLVSSYRYPGVNIDPEIAKTEANKLHDAVINKQLHDAEVFRILSTRNKSQLKETFNHYLTNYGKTIEEDIELSGKSQFTSLLKTAIWCLSTPEKHFAEVIRTSIVGLGTDEDSLSRAIVCRADIDMKKIKEEYIQRYKKTVKADVSGDTSGDYKKFLLTLTGYAD